MDGHPGIDILAFRNAPVVATRAGTVIISEDSPYGYMDDGQGGPGLGCTKDGKICNAGKVIVIDHDNGNGYYSIYAHLNKRDVNVGDWVEAGQQIGLMGNTGNAVCYVNEVPLWPWEPGADPDYCGVHLHFNIKYRNYNGLFDGLQCDILNNLGNFVNANYTPTCGNGIKGNGLWGVNINICGAPYTTYAKKTGGSGAWAPGGASTNWYAAARVNELTGVDVPIMDGQTWIDTAASYGFTVSKQPNAQLNLVSGHDLPSKGLAVWTDHIRVIEGVDTEAQVFLYSNGDGNSAYSANGYCGMEEKSFTDFWSDAGYFGTFLGYIYLTKTKPEGSFESAVATDDGQITVSGWAYDPKSPDTNIDLRITVSSGDATYPSVTMKVNNVQRSDNKKGFSLTFPTEARGNNGVWIEAIGTTAATDPSDTADLGFQYVSVSADYPRSISLTQNELSLMAGVSGGSYSATGASLAVASCQPSDAANKNVTWTSSNTNVAVVSENGEVMAKGAGTATITASVIGKPSVKAECTITVTAPAPVLPTGIELSQYQGTIEIGQQLSLTATVLPSNADDKSIQWDSSNPAVATVSNGVVRAVGEGSAVITATANAVSSIRETCTIAVVQQAEPGCDWEERSYLPPNVNTDNWEIEVKNHYSQTGSTSPGTGWTRSDTESTTYVFTGEYLSQPYPSSDANDTTLVLVDKYYYHYCSTAENGWADYWSYGQYTREGVALRPGPMDLSYYRVTATHQDTNNAKIKYYELAWTDKGTAETGYSGTVWCGHSPSPSKYWYLNHVYEKRSPVTSYIWTRDSEWLSPDQADSNAESVTYRFRLKDCDAVSYTVTFKVANGAWDDGTTTDKIVTLEGIAADTLTLTEDQIPTAGTKPDTNYKAGKWDVTPNPDTQITADITYTYTYALKNTISNTVTFKVVNGSWDDDTTADKTVTLNGYEGDTLKLTVDQIPVVGSRPASGFETGSWDTTPNTSTAVTADTVFTYSYAEVQNHDHMLRIVVDSVTAKPGDEVVVPVRITENTGIASMILCVSYDNTKLSYLGFEETGDLTGWTAGHGAREGILIWDGNESTFIGSILEMKFRVLEEAEEGVTNLTLIQEDEAYDFELNEVVVLIEPGKIDIISYLPGDLNGDGKVGTADLVMMRRIIAGYDVTVVAPADVSGDGKVGTADLVLMRRYIAGYDVVLK